MKPTELTEPLTDDMLLPDPDEEQQDEMYEHFSLTVDKGQAMLRIDKFLTNRMEGASRNRIQTAADAGNILVNGKPVKSSYKVKPLDRISIVLPYPVREVEIIPENIPLDIPYEDDDIIIVNKPAGMVVHPGHGNYSGTLVNALTYHLKDLPLFQSGDMRAGLVHRIDKNTSGILVIAKNERAHAKLAKQFFDHTIDRVYCALVWGNMESHKGSAEDGGLSGRFTRETRRYTLQSDRTSRLRQPDRMSSRNRSHPPDSRPHGVYRAPAVQRRTIWRRSDPQRHHLLQIQAVCRKLFQTAASTCTARPKPRLYSPHHRTIRPFRKRITRGYAHSNRALAQLRSQPSNRINSLSAPKFALAAYPWR